MHKALNACKVLVSPISFGKGNSGLKCKLKQAGSDVIYNSHGWQMVFQNRLTVPRGERPGHIVNPAVFDRIGL